MQNLYQTQQEQLRRWHWPVLRYPQLAGRFPLTCTEIVVLSFDSVLIENKQRSGCSSTDTEQRKNLLTL